MLCEYCRGVGSWECEDKLDRKNCEDFKLNWDILDEEQKEEIYNIISNW